MNMEHIQADWSELPVDLLGKITEKLISTSVSLSDYVRFFAVCNPWRSFLIQNYEHIKLPTRIPILLIPSDVKEQLQKLQLKGIEGVGGYSKIYQNYYDPKYEWQGEDDRRFKSSRSFYSLFERKVYDFQLPVSYYNNCRGSSHGWLITAIQDENCSVQLLNPFRSIDFKIKLPPLKACEWEPHDIVNTYLLRKAVLSASPSINPTDFVVMAIYGFFKLAFCRPGDIAWTYLPLQYEHSVHDVIYYKGQFYAILKNGLVLALDVENDSLKPKVTVIAAEPPKETSSIDRHYLVECSGDLLQVHRETHGHEAFKVFKLVGSSKWVEIKTLDGYILFLGINGSMSLSASELPGTKPNCIYFTDDRAESNFNPQYGPIDMGIFNLEEESFEAHYRTELRIMMPMPIWLQPAL